MQASTSLTNYIYRSWTRGIHAHEEEERGETQRWDSMRCCPRETITSRLQLQHFLHNLGRKQHFRKVTSLRKCYFRLGYGEKSFVNLFCCVSPVPVFENHGYFRITSFATKLDFQNKNFRLRYVKFLATSIPIDEIYIYQFVPQNLYTPFLYPFYEFRFGFYGKLYTGCSALKIHFSVSTNENRKN